MKKAQKTKKLHQYLPSKSIHIVDTWIEKYKIKLNICKARKTKLGDYRWIRGEKEHRISVNNNLNPYTFLITLVHEIAHLRIWESYGKRVKPHGVEWKQEFQSLLFFLINMKIFPSDIILALKGYMQNPPSSSCSDVNLVRVLREYDMNSDNVLLEELDINTHFQISNGRVFEKGEKIRKRYKCVELSTNRKYLFSPVAEVLKMS